MPSFYKSVNPGDAFQPLAARENALTALLAQFAPSGAPATGKAFPNALRLPIFNPSGEEIEAGCPVEVDMDKEVQEDGLLPVKPAEDGAKFFLVTASKLGENDIGSGIAMGVAEAQLSERASEAKPFVTPKGGKFAAAESGLARVIYSSSGGRAVILLGVGDAGYTGSFPVTQDEAGKLKVGGGYLNRNGFLFNYLSGSSEPIEPKTGTLCVTSKPTDKEGNWSEPKFEFATPGPTAFPLAEIKVEKGGGKEQQNLVMIRQFPVAVAIILYSIVCPIAEL